MFKTVALLSFVSVALAGCMANDAQRVILGATAGAVVADATGNNMATGAVIGGVGAGVLGGK